MTQSEARGSNGSLLLIGYAIGIMLVAIPAIELIITSLPPRPGVMEWRFSVTGLLANQLLFPVVGLGLLMLTAHALGHRRVLTALGVTAVVGSLSLVAVTGLFALDGIQLRQAVQGDSRVGFHAVVGKALINLGIATVTWGWIGWVAIRSSRRRGRKAAARQDAMVLGTASATEQVHR
jgi:amino acid transporter